MRGAAIFVCCALFCAGVATASDRIVPVDAEALGAELAARKGRVVLLNFWATWCRPCLEEIPALMDLESELAERGFDLVAVSLDHPGDRTTIVEPFMDKWFPEFSSFLSLENDMDAIVSIVDPYWNEVLPTSYLLAPDGTVAKRIQGGSTAEEFAAEVAPLLD
jgi:thiol-disulfide isomerase/thioredoxin